MMTGPIRLVVALGLVLLAAACLTAAVVALGMDAGAADWQVDDGGPRPDGGPVPDRGPAPDGGVGDGGGRTSLGYEPPGSAACRRAWCRDCR